MRRFAFRVPTDEDVAFVAANMREADRRELKRWTAQEPGYELKHSIDCSQVCYAGVFEDGKVACIFGACRANLLERTATIWSLSSTEVDRHPIEFYLGSKAGIDRIFRIFAVESGAIFDQFVYVIVRNIVGTINIVYDGI